MSFRYLIKTKYNVSFIDRLKFAWYAFNLKEIPETSIGTFEYCCDLRKDMVSDCDNLYRTGCKRNAKVALATTTFKIEICKGDYYHLCHKCAKDADGTTDKLEFKL